MKYMKGHEGKPYHEVFVLFYPFVLLHVLHGVRESI